MRKWFWTIVYLPCIASGKLGGLCDTLGLGFLAEAFYSLARFLYPEPPPSKHEIKSFLAQLLAIGVIEEVEPQPGQTSPRYLTSAFGATEEGQRLTQQLITRLGHNRDVPTPEE
jgi:hypothetical protein